MLLKTVLKNRLILNYLKNDRYVGQRVALNKYEPYETELILRQVQSGDVVVDVGANIGYYTVLLAKKVAENGKVYAFEPDKTNFEILEKNTKANKLKNVVAINAAVSDKNKMSYLYKSEDNFGDHRLYNNQFLISNDQKVKTIKLDSFIKEKVNLIKIDTQGWEPAVVKGAEKIIEKDKPIIFFEYFPSGYKSAKLDGEKMMKFIKKNYKKIFWIDEWLYIHKVLNKKKIDQICRTNKTGYADLWVKENINISDILDQFRKIKIKNLIKVFFKIFPK